MSRGPHPQALNSTEAWGGKGGGGGGGGGGCGLRVELGFTVES